MLSRRAESALQLSIEGDFNDLSRDSLGNGIYCFNSW